jgi:hypothetical protein
MEGLAWYLERIIWLTFWSLAHAETIADIENQDRDRGIMEQKEDHFEQIGGGDKKKNAQICTASMAF